MSDSTKGLAQYAQTIKLLHERFTPHPAQIAPGQALFGEGKKRIFLQAGRRFGKTKLMCYFAVRWAATKPNSNVYIIGPQLQQIREIIWHSRELHKIAPPELLDGPPHSTEGRFSFRNGSFIKVSGADNYESLRGLRYSLALVDEIKDVDQKVLDDIIIPGLSDEDAPLVIAGTPPEVAEHYYWTLVKEAKSSPDWAYFHLPTTKNPYLKPEVVERERKRLTDRGDADVFVREYMAEFVPGVKRAVFPMLSELEHVKPYPELWARIYQKHEQWEWYCAMDPGTASVFACLLLAINPYDGRVYVMDEIYKTSQMETSIGTIWPAIWARIKELNPPDDDYEWTYVVDEAATWARNELLDRYNISARATTKSLNKKAEGLSLIKDLLLAGKVVISDRCTNLLREMKGYMLGDNGQPIKRNDHAIDALRYGIGASYYSQQESAPPVKVVIPDDEKRRAYRVEDDWAAEFGNIEANYLLNDD